MTFRITRINSPCKPCLTVWRILFQTCLLPKTKWGSCTHLKVFNCHQSPSASANITIWCSTDHLAGFPTLPALQTSIELEMFCTNRHQFWRQAWTIFSLQVPLNHKLTRWIQSSSSDLSNESKLQSEEIFIAVLRMRESFSWKASQAHKGFAHEHQPVFAQLTSSTRMDESVRLLIRIQPQITSFKIYIRPLRALAVTRLLKARCRQSPIL